MIGEQEERIEEEGKRNVRYAAMLLQSYRERGRDQEQIGLQEYIKGYADKIGKPLDDFVPKQEMEGLEHRFIQLKAKLQNSVQKHSQTLDKKRQILTPYEQFKDLMAKKQLLTLRAMNFQLSAYQTTDAEEEVTRIKKILANGAWGCLDKLNQRLAKLRQLRAEVNDKDE